MQNAGHHSKPHDFHKSAQQEYQTDQNAPYQTCHSVIHCDLLVVYFSSIQTPYFGPRARERYYFKSNSKTSDGSLVWHTNFFSSLPAAPSPAFSFTPFTSTAPRATCSQ